MGESRPHLRGKLTTKETFADRLTQNGAVIS